MTAAELAEKLERLDALFVELYNYAESQSLSDTMSKSGANALRAIKGSIGNRYNVIPQAAARLRAMEEALQLIANCIHPKFRTEEDIDLLYANEKAFGQCINVARAAISGEGQ